MSTPCAVPFEVVAITEVVLATAQLPAECTTMGTFKTRSASLTVMDSSTKPTVKPNAENKHYDDKAIANFTGY